MVAMLKHHKFDAFPLLGF